MRTARMLLAATALALTLAAPAQAAPDGPTADRCRQIDGHLVAPCYGADVIQRAAEAPCRAATACPSDEPAVAAHAGSWVHRALAFQESLSRTLSLRNAP